MPATTADLVQQFVELNEERRNAEGSLNKLKERLALLEAELLKRYEHAGMQSMKTASGHTVYLRRELWAGAKDKNIDGLTRALKDVGLGELVKESVNSQTLSSWVREQEKQLAQEHGDLDVDGLLAALPAPLHPVLSIAEKFSVRCKAS